MRISDCSADVCSSDLHWIVSAALHRRVVADDHRLPSRHAPDPRDHPRARNFAAIHVARRELADLEEGRAWIEQPLDALARQQLAAARVTLAQLLVAAKPGFGAPRVKLVTHVALLTAICVERVSLPPSPP